MVGILLSLDPDNNFKNLHFYNQEKFGMRPIRFNLPRLQPVRFLVAICVCALLVLSTAFPAYSDPVNITGSKTVPQQGEEQLRGIEREAQEAVLKDPYSEKKTANKANEGLNEIQGSADINKMYRPENSQGARSVEDKSKNFLEGLTGKAKDDN